MLKILALKWAENEAELRSVLSKRTDLNEIEYKDIVKLTFEIIYNKGSSRYYDKTVIDLDLERIHQIDDGNYQGTLLFVIPFDIYQPSEYEYLMTYVGYGSCSGCDTLQIIQGYYNTDKKISAFMELCKDIITNTIKPYNDGWRKIELFNHIEEEK